MSRLFLNKFKGSRKIFKDSERQTPNHHTPNNEGLDLAKTELNTALASNDFSMRNPNKTLKLLFIQPYRRLMLKQNNKRQNHQARPRLRPQSSQHAQKTATSG